MEQPSNRQARPGMAPRLAAHPSVAAVLDRRAEREAAERAASRELPGRPLGADDEAAARRAPRVIDGGWLREVALRAGADDVSAVPLDRPELAGEREHVERALPGTRALISLVVRMNRDNVRSPERSVANQEFHRSGEIINEAARSVVRELQDAGYRAVNPSATFPMEMDRYPGRIWVVAHKTVAVAAGLGAIGIHRNVIHPRFGSFVLLATILVAADVSEYGEPIDYNPCLECKLCIAACPVGAIAKDGSFDFFACFTHNYREFMGGFTDWVETVADSRDGADFRARVTDSENASMWQSLSFKANYKAAYCLAVCPAGEDVLEPYLDDRKEFMSLVLRPLQDKVENLYVIAGSPAELHARRRFPHKPIKHVGRAGKPADAAGDAGGDMDARRPAP
ncbi:(4Fe-4S)-binding protein [Frankia sp. CNm7]|uniref:(4Fe-4S)-binding protein n=1 Tax=Frankia nepalensis TaxID=1836974 RepID=A0A937UND5_9ACTN|nr:(4Fe-4S)-binding protein [Frankia nepalensis]MBL7498429.1 (4Fe-4S)-binding protein [Frankia nepalensis]MBL7509957.1 (4Fe-4S)-binding protein [Frankia nepalensis]MBL7520175.1 (4Fe-4S)-binding protein [Frankia nepalensis]MBL7629759.1 (4Fe-4S)-binding protein [Frankia nepalensis]